MQADKGNLRRPGNPKSWSAASTNIEGRTNKFSGVLPFNNRSSCHIKVLFGPNIITERHDLGRAEYICFLTSKIIS
jgi:hypothetical protein